MGWPEGSVIVVTGAAGGIGHAVAAWLDARGARVFSLDRPGAEPTIGEPVEADVCSLESLGAAAEHVLAAAGRVDGLVAAAGVAESSTPAEDMTSDVWSRTLAVNLTGVFSTCQVFGRPMLAQRSGRVVTVASMSGQHVVNVPQRQVAYNASKAGVVAMTKSLALEWADRGVRVNVVSPGYVDTPLLTARADLHGGWKQATPAGRFASPEEIAAAAGWLLGDEAAFCVGTELLVDGGYSLA